jgi:predicted nuclease of predicted toxin-antitoxin system
VTALIGFLADENFSGRILRRLRRLRPDLDIVTVQQSGLSGADDPAVLEWAAASGRIVLTHDVQTMVGYAWRRVAAGIKMPGLIIVRQETGERVIVENIILIAECLDADEWEGQVQFLPL